RKYFFVKCDQICGFRTLICENIYKFFMKGKTFFYIRKGPQFFQKFLAKNILLLIFNQFCIGRIQVFRVKRKNIICFLKIPGTYSEVNVPKTYISGGK